MVIDYNYYCLTNLERTEGSTVLNDVQAQYSPCLEELGHVEQVDKIIYATQNYLKQRKKMDKHML